MSINLKTAPQPVISLRPAAEVVQTYHLCLAWNWEYDADFARLLEEVCLKRGIDLLQVTPLNLEEKLRYLRAGEIFFLSLLDRATDTDQRFYPLVDWARPRPVYRLNCMENAHRAWDKVAMGKILQAARLQIPKTVVLPSYDEQPDLEKLDLGALGSRFVIKPAHGGAGRGVIPWANSWDQVLAARQTFAHDQYLLQEFITPVSLQNRPAWFRAIYSAGEIFLFWWDTRTHVYTPLTRYEEERFSLQPLRKIIQTVHFLCGLELFSTEIALTQEGRFWVVDYVNDPIDLRLQSKAIDGVPDEVVKAIAASLVQSVLHSLPGGERRWAHSAYDPVRLPALYG
jgi:hypothetical protein